MLAKYRSAHDFGALEPERATRYERALVALARGAPWLARAMDVHARVFANGSLLRRKLVLLLAILESRSPSAEALDAPTPGSRTGMFLRLAWLAAVFALTLLVGAVLLLPVRLACACGGAE